MRHGQAAWQAPTDAERPLTEAGILRLRQRLLQLDGVLAGVEQIVHSPYLRARQTAELVAERLQLDSLLQDSRWTPEGDPQAALQSLEGYVGRTTLVVTHLPLIGHVTSLLCHGRQVPPEPFECAAVAVLEAEWPAAGLATLRQKIG